MTQGDDVYSSQPVGRVAYTKPAAGKKTDNGDEITIYPSKGEEKKYAKVPNLIGLTRSQARRELKKVGLELGSESTSYSAVQKNRVCVQSVSKNTQVEQGTTVDITLSLGEEQTYTYEGSVTINNPFDYPEDPAEEFEFVLTQDGKDTSIKKVTLGPNQFPYLLEVTGKSANTGKISVYRSGTVVDTYSISFKRVVG